MKIRSFDIHEFGFLEKQSLSLTDGLCIFLGKNEAGKSTALEFFRTMLTGFPSSRLKKAKEGVFANKSKMMGGVLELESLYAGNLKIERKANSFQVFNSEGAPLSLAVYENLLSNINRDIYSALYGFSLNELQTLQSLEDEEVQAVLYGASSALHAFSPQQALVQIENTLSAKGSKSLLTTDSFKNFFKTNCLRIEQINAEMKHIITQNKEIDAIYAEAKEKSEKIHTLRNQKNSKQSELHLIQSKIQAWQAYSDWHILGQKIQRIPDLAKNFPANGLEKLRTFEEKITTILEEIQEKDKEKTALKERIDAKILNATLIEKQHDINALTEFKSSYRNALNELPLLEKKAQDTREELSAQLTHLGDTWSIEKIETLDFSIQNQEKIEEYGEKLESFSQKITYTQEKIHLLNQELKSLDSEIFSCQEKIDSLPKAIITINPQDHTKLEEYYAKAVHSHALTERKKAELLKCTNELESALQNYSFEFELTEEKLNALLENQHKAYIIAKSIQIQEEKKKDEEQYIKQVEKEMSKAEERKTLLLQEINQLNAKESSEIYKEEEQLNLLQKAKQEQTRLREIFKETRQNIRECTLLLKFSAKKISLELILFLLSFLSLFSFYLSAFTDISSLSTLSITNSALAPILPFLTKLPPSIELSASLSLTLFAIFFAFFLYFMPAINPDMKKARKILMQSLHKEEEVKSRLEELSKSTHKLYSFFGIEKLPVDFFENKMLQLREEFEKSQKSFFLQEKIFENTKERERLEEEKEKNTEFCHIIHESHERSLAQWQEFFAPYNFAKTPLAEHAHRDFARLEQVKLCLQAKKYAEAELLSIEEDIKKLSALITSILPEIAKAYTESEAHVLLEQAREILSKYSEEVKDGQILSTLQENISTLKAKKEQILSTLVQKQEELAHFTEKRSETEESYYTYLQEKHFYEKLPAQNVKARLTQAEKCLQIHKQLQHVLYEIEQDNLQIQAFALPLSRILQELGHKEGDISSLELLHEFDMLLKECQKQCTLEQEKIRELGILARFEENISQKQEQMTQISGNIQALLHSVSLDNRAEFEEQAKHAFEYLEFSKELQHIEDKLQFLARQKPLKEFIQEFEGVELATLQSSSLELEEEVKDIQAFEDEENTALAKLKAQIEMLENSSQLSELKQEKSSLEEKNAHALDTYMTYALAQSFIKKTKAEYEREKQPELIKKASEIFSFITDGKWKNIVCSLDNKDLTLNPASGSPLTPDRLSQGTKEQLYLSLRLAYILLANQYKESLPLLMDDIFVNFDLQRASQSAKTLAKIIEDDKNQQILFFTCHEHIATLLKECNPSSSLYVIEKGIITSRLCF